jgi:NADPH:quinone reductase-like Zn-dependent oxidoreductase
LGFIPRPEFVPKNLVLIKVTHAALNPTTFTLIRSAPNPFGDVRIPELDFAGVVISEGESVRPDLQQQGTCVSVIVGPTRQLDFPTLRWKKGTMAGHVLAFQDHVVVKPPNISMCEAAGVGAVGSTAIRFLDCGKIQRGDSILISGASSGCGTTLVQISKSIVGKERSLPLLSCKCGFGQRTRRQ